MHTFLLRLSTELNQTLEPLSATQTQANPLDRSYKWNIQQIVEHLLLTYRLCSAAFEQRIARPRRDLPAPRINQRLAQLLYLHLNFVPAESRSPAIYVPTRPISLRTGAELTLRIHSDLVRLDALLSKAELLLGSRQAVAHPALGPLTVNQWRRFHLNHGLHHLRQIKRIHLLATS